MNVWLFHANNEYILTDKVPPLLGQVETWDAVTNFKRIEAGDKVVLWQSAVGGLAPGIYALGEIDGRPYMYVGDDYCRADIRYTHLLESPLLKQQLLDDPLLGTLLVIKNPNAANPSHVTNEQWSAVESRARRSPTVESTSGGV